LDKLPTKLEEDPILEAVFELRFQAMTTSAADLLPGILYNAVRDDFPKLERLPISMMPRELVASQPDLKYQPRYRLSGKKFALLLGDVVFAISCPKPYIGWKEFRKTILSLLGHVRDSKFVEKIERFSLKYLNVLQGAQLADQYKLVNFSASFGKFDIASGFPVQVRTEINAKDFYHIVELASGATIKLVSGEALEGLMLTIDTISNNPDNFWSDVEKKIEALHLAEKTLFFDVLSKAGLERYKPVWE
jgi:uncharacterized protein (TIGR04255 family)